MLATSMLALLIAVPAWAGHDSRASCGVGSVDGYVAGVRFGYRSGGYECDADRDYRRGFERGSRRGFKAGYRDGFDGRPYCGEVSRRFKGRSHYFVKGYFEAYGRAYERGFRRGRADCGGRSYGRRYQRGW